MFLLIREYVVRVVTRLFGADRLFSAGIFVLVSQKLDSPGRDGTVFTRRRKCGHAAEATRSGRCSGVNFVFVFCE